MCACQEIWQILILLSSLSVMSRLLLVAFSVWSHGAKGAGGVLSWECLSAHTVPASHCWLNYSQHRWSGRDPALYNSPNASNREKNTGDLQWVSLLTSNYYIFLFYLHINCIILLSSAKKQNKIFHQRKCFFNSTAKLVLCESVGAVWYKLSNIIYHFPVGLTSPNKPDSIKILRIAPCVGLTDDSPDD